jgi:hypothetical protein
MISISTPRVNKMISISTPHNKPIKARDIEERSPDQIANDNASNADKIKYCRDYFTVDNVSKTMKCKICWASANKSLHKVLKNHANSTCYVSHLTSMHKGIKNCTIINK